MPKLQHKVPSLALAAPVVSTRHQPLAAHQVAASDKSMGVARSTVNMTTLARKPRSRPLSYKLGGSTPGLKSECMLRLHGVAHVSSTADNDAVLGFVKYSTLITSLKVTSASSAHNEAHGSGRVLR